jgi:hypothetical protein
MEGILLQIPDLRFVKQKIYILDASWFFPKEDCKEKQANR